MCFPQIACRGLQGTLPGSAGRQHVRVTLKRRVVLTNVNTRYCTEVSGAFLAWGGGGWRRRLCGWSHLWRLSQLNCRGISYLAHGHCASQRREVCSEWRSRFYFLKCRLRRLRLGSTPLRNNWAKVNEIPVKRAANVTLEGKVALMLILFHKLVSTAVSKMVSSQILDTWTFKVCLQNECSKLARTITYVVHKKPRWHIHFAHTLQMPVIGQTSVAKLALVV